MTLSRIDQRKDNQGYQPIVMTGYSCRNCAHAAERPSGQLNCNKGSFWVARVGGCRQFQANSSDKKD